MDLDVEVSRKKNTVLLSGYSYSYFLVPCSDSGTFNF